MSHQRPAEISGSTLCTQQPCEWYTSHPSGVCAGCRCTCREPNWQPGVRCPVHMPRTQERPVMSPWELLQSPATSDHPPRTGGFAGDVEEEVPNA